MIGAINHTFRAALESFPAMLMFGEDIEDPKGGVFGLTAGLSRRFPGRVVNSPLAEGTIVGLGVGVAAAGFRPVFELQFIDFVGPGFNQLVNQMTTLRWRSKGEWTCPLVLYAPYGAYLPAGGMWHSQSNDGWWAHTPGLRVAIPSTPEDAVGLFWAAFQNEDPALVLIPKHLCRVRMPVQRFDVVPFGRASVRRAGDDVTLVSWGNGVELAEKSAQRMAAEGVSVEVIDLRTLVPCDWASIERSLQKTGRLVVVHEDNRTCGFGQAVITEMTAQPERFDLLLSPPQLVARPDIHIPFCPDLESALLPDVDRVLSAIRVTLE
jgi:2-oxoisovalerate dehydrogenase E1 component